MPTPYDLAEQIANRLDDPGGIGRSQPAASPFGQGLGFNASDGPGAAGQDNEAGVVAANGDNPQSPQSPSAKQQEPAGLDGILSGLSRDDLQNLKFALNKASLATAAFAVPIRALLFVISPSLLTVTVISGGLTIMSVGLAYLSSEIDKYLSTP